MKRRFVRILAFVARVRIASRLCRALAGGLLAAALAAPVHATWREIERFEDGVRVYVDDAATGVRAEDMARLPHLVRWNEPQRDGEAAQESAQEMTQKAAQNGRKAADPSVYLSTLVQAQYDCRARRFRYLSSVSFAGPMGDGAEVSADEGDDVESGRWEPVSSGSMEEKLWKIACGIP